MLPGLCRILPRLSGMVCPLKGTRSEGRGGQRMQEGERKVRLQWHLPVKPREREVSVRLIDFSPRGWDCGLQATCSVIWGAGALSVGLFPRLRMEGNWVA